MSFPSLRRFVRASVVVSLAALTIAGGRGLLGQEDESAAAKRVYDQIKRFALTGGAADVTNLTLKRDRVEMTFTGTFYFVAPVDGRVTGAVFVGQGTMRAAVPASDFERENVKRLIGADLVESDFRTAVLRWTDDTLAALDVKPRDGVPAPAQAERLAAEFEPRFLTETGASLSARLALSVLNAETPGVFFAQFDGGRRDRFSVLLDQQTRIPVSNFAINGGEKGLIFAWQPAIYGNDVWMAFYAAQDYERGAVPYSDTNDLVDVTNYQMDLDLRQLDRRLGIVAKIDMEARAPNIRAIPFKIGESLSIVQRTRLEKQLRVKAARLGGQSVAWTQEDWEGGFTVFLPKPAQAKQALTLEVELEGDFIRGDVVPECFYPISNTSWYPRHGYLDRATFDLTFRHRKREKVASVGVRLSEQPDPADPSAVITKYRMSHPVALVVFALGPFERKTQTVTWEAGGDPIPLEFNSVPSRVFPIKADFILAELDNAVRYFAAMFGKYPYPAYGAAFHPYGFGQGFPTLLMIPPTDRAERGTFAFMAHETAHQWWGNIVAWRSYRDQWLSEGFAEYSGILYTAKRDDKKESAGEIIKLLRQSLLNTPRTALGVGRGRLNDIGPIILGLRLNTSQSAGAYQTLIYNKGALVLRMLHFLLSHPTTGDDKAFVAMMTAFVERHRNGTASTDDFRKVANEHFARSPMAQKYGLTDLNWFFSQWVYQTGLPSYQLEYELKDQPDGSVMISGAVRQDNVASDWFMPLPIVFSFDNNQVARTTVRAFGPSTPFELKLPAKPRKVELDPGSWVLSEKTLTKAK